MNPRDSSLLIAAAIDLAGHGWPDGLADRMAGSLGLGKGGDVLRHGGGNAILLSRAPGQPAAAAGGQTRVRRPCLTEHGAHVLFAGYLQDRADLRQRLGLSPDQPLSDAQLYGKAHARWGEDCDRQITGHYAAILWFAGQGLIRAARSPLDPSPLHWWSEGARIIIATTPRAIFAAGVAQRLDDTKLDMALLGCVPEEGRSWFSGIGRLEGGMVMTWRRGGLSQHRFWSIESAADVRLRRDEDYVEALDSLFARATAEALHGFRRPGLLLSGGLDSTAVASYLLDATSPQQRLDCFTSVPASGFVPIERVESFPDERAHVQAMAAMHPRLHIDYVDAAEHNFNYMLSEMFLLGSTMPLAALNLHWIHASLARAGEAGCDVMFTGSNGNATFSYDGDTAFAWWLRRGRLGRLLRELGAVDQARPMIRRLITWAIMPSLPDGLRSRLGALAGSARPDALQWSPLGSDYRRERGLGEMATPFAPGPARSSRQAQHRLMVMASSEGGDIELALELLHGLPFRDPTTYRPLVEFCFGIPEDQYRRDGVSRWLARRVLKGRIPEAVRLENRKGQQAADWPQRIMSACPALIAELREMAENPQLAGRFDCPRIVQTLEEWDGSDARFSKAYEKVALASSRAIVASRFIRFANGSNQ